MLQNVDSLGTHLRSARRPSRIIADGNTTYLAYKCGSSGDKYMVEKIVQVDENTIITYTANSPVAIADIASAAYVETYY